MRHEAILPRSRAKFKASALFTPPLLPTLVDKPPEGDLWEHEIKYDGYRTLIVARNGEGRAFTRNGHDWSHLYSRLVAASCRLSATSAVLDGEVIVQDEQGRSDFAKLRGAITGEPHRLIFMAFDLLELDGSDLRNEPLSDRRARLEELVGRHDPASTIQFSESLSISGDDVLDAACSLGLEGIVSKKLNSGYRSGRHRSWLKTKCYDESDLVVVGAEREPGQPAFALLARETGDGLEYAGSAFLTLGGRERDQFWKAVEQHARKTPPLKVEKRKGRNWTDPVLRVRAQHLKGEGKLRHATIREILE